MDTCDEEAKGPVSNPKKFKKKCIFALLEFPALVPIGGQS